MKTRLLSVVSVLVLVGLLLAMSVLPAVAVSNTLVISQVFYDTPGTDADEEWIEIYNLSAAVVDLGNYKIGDEETQGGTEGMFQFPAGASIAPGQKVVVAQKATGFYALYGYNPDFELADTDPTVPDMSKYAAWASGSVALGNGGDEVLLLDGSDTVVDTVVYEAGSYPGVTPHPGVSTGHSLRREPITQDTDDCSVDFTDEATPTPPEVVYVSQPTYLTANSAYDRNPSPYYDGSNYWVFYTKGDDTSTGGVRGGGYDPDADAYVIYYRTASSVLDLATATEQVVTPSQPTPSGSRPANFHQRVADGIVFSGGDILVIASSGQEGPDRNFYRYNYTSGSWSGPTQVVPTSGTISGGHVDLAYDGSTIYMVWEDGSGSSAFSKSTDGGSTWSTPTIISTDNMPKIDVDASGNLYVIGIDVSTADINLYTSTNGGASWSGPAVVFAGAGLYDPVIAVHGSDLYAFTAPYDGGSDRQQIIAAMSTDGGASWSSPATVTNGGYGGTYWWDYWPEALSDGTDLYLFYTTEKDGSTLGDGEVADFKMDWPLSRHHYEAIQPAVDNVAGSTVKVEAGVYTETITFAAGFSKDNLTISGDASSRPVVNGGIKFQNSTAITGISFENLYLKGDAGGGVIIRGSNTGPINDFSMDNCVLDGENVSGRSGVAGNKFGESFSITNTEFKDILGFAVMDIDSNSDYSPWGGNGLKLTTVTFANNNVHECNGSIALRGHYTETTTTVNVYNNTWSNIGGNSGETGEQWAALEVNHAQTVNVYDNTVDGVQEGLWGEGQAFQFWDVGTLDVHDNSVTNNYQGIYIFCGDAGNPYGGPYAMPGGSIYHNVITGNDQYGVSADATCTGGPLNAEDNWWGTLSWAGYTTSGGTVTGIEDMINGDVDYEPWQNATFSQGYSKPSITYADDDDDSGTNEGDAGNSGGTFGYDAFSRVQDAINNVSGSTVNVADGIYTATSLVAVQITKPLTLTGQSRDGTIIEGGTWGQTGTGWPKGIHVITDSVTIQNLTVRGFTGDMVSTGGYGIVMRDYANNPSYAPCGVNYSGVTLDNVRVQNSYSAIYALCFSDLTVQSALVENAYSDGMFIAKTATNTVITNSTVITAGDHGIWVGISWDGIGPSDNATIVNNTVDGAREGGISFVGSNGAVIRGNYVTGVKGEEPPAGWSRGAISLKDGPTNVLVDSNTIVANDGQGTGSGRGIGIDGAASAITITHNFIRANAEDGIKVLDTASGIVIHSNLICNNSAYGIENVSSNVPDAIGNWWGHNAPIVSGTDYTGAVTVSPNVTRTLATSLDAVDPAGGDTLIATVVYSDGAAYTVPDGVVITWTVSGGTPAVLTSTTQSGVASVQVTDDATAGMVITAADCCGFSQQVVLQPGRVENLDTSEWFTTIQEAIDDADTTDGHTLLAHSGTYTEDLTISKGITLAGEGQANTILYPATSVPTCASLSSLCGYAATSMAIVQAADVTIHDMTLDGNNPILTSGVVVNGVDVDARNGIIGDYYAATPNNLTVYNVTVRNVYLRGIYATGTGPLTGVDFHDNVVQNVAGLSDHSVAMMFWNVTGSMVDNTVEDVVRGLACFVDSTCLLQGNVITDAEESGIYVSWNLASPAGTTVTNNTVTGGWMGIEIYYQDTPLTVTHNVVNDAIVGINVGGRSSDPLIVDNQIDGSGVVTATGIMVETWGHGDTDRETSATLRDNDIYNTDNGVALLSGTGLTVTAVLKGNLISGTLSSGVVITGPGALDVTLGDSPAATNTFRGSSGYAVQLIDATDDVPARFNDWDFTDLAAIEGKIHHQPDDPALGEVLYYGITLSDDGSSPMADGASYATITATLTGLLSPAGNVISLTTDLGTLGATIGTADASGTVTTTITSTTTGTATITGMAGMAGPNPKSDTTQVTFASLALDHFHIYPIQDQVAGVGFPVSISARDASDQTVNAFNGWATLTDATTTLAPTAPIQFHNGVWSGMVTVTQIYAGDVVTVTYLHDTSKYGASNAFDVNHGTVVSITLSPASETVVAGESVTYTVWATDTLGNGWDATSEICCCIMSPGAGGSWADNVYTSEYAGVWTATATVDGVTDTATLTVTHGPATEITLAPDPSTITAGTGVTYTVTASDGYGNTWDVSASADYTITSGAGGSWNDNVYTSEFVGTWTVIATWGSLSDTATLDVIAATVAEISVSPENAQVTAGQSIAYTVIATDTFGNSWDATSGTYFTIDGVARGSWATNVYTSEVAGWWTVTATYGGQSDTASLRVIHDKVTSISLSPETSTIVAGEAVIYTVRASDSYGNTWNATDSVSYSITPGAGGSWSDNVYTSQFAGTWTVTAVTWNGKSDTATLTVEHGPAAIVTLSPASETVVAGESVTYTVWATDTLGNGWDATSEMCCCIMSPDAGGSWADNVYTSEYAGVWTATATVDGVTGTATLTVTHGPATGITLAPDPSTVTAGADATYTVTASDGYGNTWDVSASADYTITSGAGGSWNDNVYTSEFVGTWTVIATWGSLSDTATLDVIAATVAEISVSPENAQVTAGQSIAYTVIATDTVGNSWDATSGTYFTIDSGAKGSWAANVYTSEEVGGWMVTAVYGGQSDTASLTVTAGLPQSIEYVSGRGQSSQTGMTLAPFVVAVKDDQGNPVSGVPVTYTITGAPAGATGQSLSTTSTNTLSDGQASSTLTLGDAPGVYTVTASSAGLSGSPVVFTATAAAPGLLPSSKTVDKAVANAGQTLTYTIMLVNDQPVSTTMLLYDPIPAQTAYVSGSVSGGAFTTPMMGQAQLAATNLGDLRATLSASGEADAILWNDVLPPYSTHIVTFAVRINAGAQGIITNTAAVYENSQLAATLTATTELKQYALLLTSGNDQGGQVGDTLAPFVVTVQDEDEQGVGGIPVEFAITGTPEGATGQWLSVQNATTDASGQASTVLTLGSHPGVYTVTASSPGLNGSPVVFVATAVAPDVASFSKSVDKSEAEAGEVLTYTIVLANDSPVSTTLMLYDPIPADTTCITESIEGGAFPVSGASAEQLAALDLPSSVVLGATEAVIWQGTLSPYSTHTITFAVHINTEAWGTITNTAFIYEDSQNIATLTANTATKHFFYLPLILNGQP